MRHRREVAGRALKTKRERERDKQTDKQTERGKETKSGW